MDMRSVSTGRFSATACVQVQLDPLHFLGGDGLKVGEVEAQALRRHQRAGLLDVLAQMPPQHRLEDMGGGVVPGDAAAPGRVHCQVGLVVDLDRPFLHHPLVDEEIIGQPLGVGHPDAPAVAADDAGVPHLAAGFAVKGGGGR